MGAQESRLEWRIGVKIIRFWYLVFDQYVAGLVNFGIQFFKVTVGV